MEYGEQVFALLDVEDPSSYQGVDPNPGQGCLFLDRAGRVLYGSSCMLGEDGKGAMNRDASCTRSTFASISLFQCLKEISMRHKEIMKFEDLILLDNVLGSPAFNVSLAASYLWLTFPAFS